MSNVDHTLFETVLRNTLIHPHKNVKYARLRRPLSQLVEYNKRRIQLIERSTIIRNDATQGCYTLITSVDSVNNE